jgi:hypothetical protein
MHRSHNTKLPKPKTRPALSITAIPRIRLATPRKCTVQLHQRSQEQGGVHVHVLRKGDKSLSSVRHKGTFVGYATDSRCYLVHYDQARIEA